MSTLHADDPHQRPTVLVFGDSHSVSLQNALRRRAEQGQDRPLTVFRRLKWKADQRVGDITFNEFRSRISKLGPDDVAVSMIGGSHYAVFGTIQHPRPFDFFTENQAPTADSSAEIIPYRALRSVFSESITKGIDSDGLAIRGDGVMLDKLRRATSARVIHIMPPPPVWSSDTLMERPDPSLARRDIRGLGVSPPELRLKFWSLQVRIVTKFCVKRGIEVLMPPREAFQNGYLRPDLHASGAHANSEYGELVLAQIEEALINARQQDLPAQSRVG